MSNHTFTIINASAGAGKTFSLVKHYLLLLLQAKQPTAFQNILALTFTNKAVAEMKGRLIKMLWALANVPAKESAMCEALLTELSLTQKQLQEKCHIILRKILKDYGRFEVITLDKLTYSLVRTFAKDLKLPYEFEVVLQAEELLRNMLHLMMDQIGSDVYLTKTLLEFSQFKMTQDKNWDVEKELFDMAKSLLKENDRRALGAIQQLHETDWINLKNQFLSQIQKIENQLVEAAQYTISEIERQGLTPDDFFKKLLYNHFKKITEKQFEKLFNNQLGLALEGEKPLYKKGTAETTVQIIEALRSFLKKQYFLTKDLIAQWSLGQAVLKQWTPMSLLREMEKRLNDLQKEQQKMLLGQFNTRISKVVQDQPVPFIFERLGAQYQHFFIDEFQDTSELQWENLVPLIGNALESETTLGEKGSLFLVGDPKQAIYRWRGGNNQQFLELLMKKTPFQIDPNIENLSHNYRSFDEIVHFNNQFFSSVLEHLSSVTLKTLFKESASQLTTTKEGGLVSLTFIPKNLKKEEALPHYIKHTIEQIKASVTQGYRFGDMALLVRTTEQAKALGAALLEGEIPFLSQESLFLSEAANIQFLIQLLQLTVMPEEKWLKKGLLDYAWEYGSTQNIPYHFFITTHLNLSLSSFFNALNQQFHSTFNFNSFQKYSLYEALLYALSAFSFLKKQDAFMLYFLEHVFEYNMQYGGNKTAFLTHWERVSEELKLVQPEDEDAVQIMTIHKAKGLEFPLVILPFLDQDLYVKSAFPVWFPLQDSSYSELPWAYLSFSKKIEEYGPQGKLFFKQQRYAQETDALNVLYVAMTRAKNELHIITKNTDSDIKTYAFLFKEFAMQKGKEVGDNSSFFWGKPTIQNQDMEVEGEEQFLQIRSNFKWKEKLIAPEVYLKSAGQKARKEGLLLHHLMEKIDRATPKEIVDEESQLQGTNNSEVRQTYTTLLEKIIDHPKLKLYYNTRVKVYCEQEILVPHQSTLRPDRLVVCQDHTAIIDYKAGTPKNEDIQQMQAYETALLDMGINKIKKYLVYTQNGLNVKELE